MREGAEMEWEGRGSSGKGGGSSGEGRGSSGEGGGCEEGQHFGSWKHGYLKTLCRH